MRKIQSVIFLGILFCVACNPAENKKTPVADTVSTVEKTLPGIEKVSFSDTIHLQAGEDMRFDKELFRVKAGKKLRLILHNTAKKSSMAMSHNVVVLVSGTDLADFADLARKAKDEQYVPASVASLVIAHTPLVAGGETRELDFQISQPGVYDFICSYPGHWGTMQGKIVAE